ncbi:hypothetical protein J14TS5_55560 [Paenibacillus lautus]|nr:hypothetical protein J14TS5_55560 [Paenibacillus lautus]
MKRRGEFRINTCVSILDNMEGTDEEKRLYQDRLSVVEFGCWNNFGICGSSTCKRTGEDEAGEREC